MGRDLGFFPCGWGGRLNARRNARSIRWAISSLLNSSSDDFISDTVLETTSQMADRHPRWDQASSLQ
jgi:hypothetical protein